MDLVGENTVHLDSELKKIALAHRGTDAVNEHEIMGLANGTVLQAATTSPPRAVSPLNSSALNDRSPSAERRARRRFITASRLSASSPTMR